MTNWMHTKRFKYPLRKLSFLHVSLQTPYDKHNKTKCKIVKKLISATKVETLKLTLHLLITSPVFS